MCVGGGGGVGRREEVWGEGRGGGGRRCGEGTDANTGSDDQIQILDLQPFVYQLLQVLHDTV